MTKYVDRFAIIIIIVLKYDRFAISCKEQLGTSFGCSWGRETKGFFFYNKQIIVGHLINNIALAIERRMANDWGVHTNGRCYMFAMCNIISESRH